MTEQEALDALKAAAVEANDMWEAYNRECLYLGDATPAISAAFLDAEAALSAAGRTYARTLKEPHV